MPLFLLPSARELHAQSGQGFAPLIRLQAPEIGKDSVVVTTEGTITLSGRVFSPAKVMVVMVGNSATDQRVTADLQGDGGDFNAKVPLAAGENKLVVVTSAADNGTATLRFRVMCEGAGAAPRASTKAPAAKEPMNKAPVTPVPEPPVVQQPARKEPPPPVGGSEKAVSPAASDGEEVFSREAVLGTSTAAVPSAQGSVHAVVVGVSTYENDEALELRYAVRDAQAFGEHLLATNGLHVPRANITFLMNGEATGEALRIALRQAAARAGSNDLFLFYFAGHGINDGNGRLCLLPYDASIATAESMWSTGLTQSALLDAMSSARCQHRLVILDACQSGLLASGNAGVDTRVLASAGEDLHVLTATRPGEVALESARLGGGHGLFSHVLLNALAGAADGADGSAKDGSITLAEAYDHLRVRMPTLAAELGGGAQHPVLQGGAGGTIVLGRKGGSANDADARTVKEDAPVAATKQTVDDDVRFVPIPEEKTEIDGVVFTDVETGEKVRFFNKNETWSDVSGMVNGVIFHGRAFLKGKTFEFTDLDEKRAQRQWHLEMTHDWSEVRVDHTTNGVTSASRTLRRIGIPERLELKEGLVFADAVKDQRLQVVEQRNSWMRITGNLGTRIVDLVAVMHGDVYDLRDESPGWIATGRMVMSDRWDEFSGSLTFEDGKQVPFVLRSQGVVSDRPLEDVTYRDLAAKTYEITFYNERPGSVVFNGNLRPGKVEIVCYKHGNVLHCVDNSGRMEPFRLLLKNDRKKVLGQIMLKTEKGIFVVDMSRVGNEGAR